MRRRVKGKGIGKGMGGRMIRVLGGGVIGRKK